MDLMLLMESYTSLVINYNFFYNFSQGMESEKDSTPTVQNNIITSSSDMEQMEPPAKRNKIETENIAVVGSEVGKENGK